MPKRNSRAPRRPVPTVGDALASVEQIAPLRLAADWDNVGLLAGRPEWPVRRALVAIDLTDAVADEALRSGVDIVVTYHPPIFKGIRGVTPTCDAPTTRLPDLLAARVSIIALHTALDAAPGGTNDALLDAFDLAGREPLEPLVTRDRQYKLVVFVPPAEAERLRAALSAAGAGVIGHYDECGFATPGRGSFRGDETTHPAIGRRGELEFVDELRLEMVAPAARVGEVVRALYANHSYEEPAFDIYPLHEVAARGAAGMGRVGVLRRPTRGAALVRRLAVQLSAVGVDFGCATVVGSLQKPFARVIAAAGSFGVRAFRDPAALVLTGEFKHHDALDLLKRGVTAICLGHDASERPVLPRVQDHLRQSVPGLRVALSRADRSPFARLV